MKSKSTLFTGLIVLLFLFPFLGQAQSDSTLIKEVVLQLFDGMRASDTTMVKSAFHDKASMYTTVQRNGAAGIQTYQVADFVKSVGTPHDVVYDERLGDYSLEIDEVLATMAVKYYFYLGESPSHCGTNFFTFFKSNDGWKIISIADTRRKEPCDLPPFTW